MDGEVDALPFLITTCKENYGKTLKDATRDCDLTIDGIQSVPGMLL